MHNYPRVLEQVYNTPWMITEPGLRTITEIVERKLTGESLTEQEMALVTGGKSNARAPLELPTEPSAAVLPIHGTLFPKANLMTQMSGATSVENMREDFKQLVESDMVTHIILDFDSPGGSVDGIAEFANDIFNARGIKPITSVANGLCCSAAYYLATQADSLYASDSAQVGNIGVIAVHREDSIKQEKEGVTTTVMTAGENKHLGNPHKPLTEQDKILIQEMLDENYEDFVGAVARGRGVETSEVLANYGQGLWYKPKKALRKGMIDGVKTLDAVVSELGISEDKSDALALSNAIRTGASVTIGGITMEGFTPETLAILGLSEGATIEDINIAIAAMNDELTPLRTLKDLTEKKSDFASQFPEEAAELAAQREAGITMRAELFSSKYTKFVREEGGIEFGLSSLALESVADMHSAIAKREVTHESLEKFLDVVVSGNAVVQYGEVGSGRGKEPRDADDTKGAIAEFATKISEVMKRDDLDYEMAMDVASRENPELAVAYAQTYRHTAKNS